MASINPVRDNVAEDCFEHWYTPLTRVTPLSKACAVALCWLFFMVVVPGTVRANDYAENFETNVSVKTIPVCTSITNIDEHKDDYLFVYDYSSSTGKNAGVPWVLVEQGVCYETDFTDMIYAFKKPLHPQVYAVLSPTTQWSYDMSLDDVLDIPAVRGSRAFATLIPAMRGSTEDLVYGISEVDVALLLPTRYAPGQGFTGWSGIYAGHPIEEHARYDETYALLLQLKEGVESTIAECDARTKVEVRSSIEFTSHTEHPLYVSGYVAWHIPRYGVIDTWFGRGSATTTIEVLGCTNAVQTYLRDKKETIEKLDMLLTTIYESYTEPADWSGAPYAKFTFSPRSGSEYEKLLAYAYYGVRSPFDKSIIKTVEAVPHSRQVLGPVATTVQNSMGQSVTSTSAMSTQDAPTSSALLHEQRQGQQDYAKALETQSTQTFNGRIWLAYFVLLPAVGVILLFVLYMNHARRKKCVNVATEVSDEDQHDA